MARRASIRERNQKGHLKGSEAAKFLLHKYARRVNDALAAVLAGRSAPLVLAADEPLASLAPTFGRGAMPPQLRKRLDLHPMGRAGPDRRRARQACLSAMSPVHIKDSPAVLFLHVWITALARTCGRI